MKKSTLKAVLAGFALVGTFTLNAQINSTKITNSQITSNNITLTDANKESVAKTGIAPCLTDENEKELQKRFPTKYTKQQFEDWLAPHLTKLKADRAAGVSRRVAYNIPVVIHVIHDGDQVNSIGNIVDENISAEQALSQITVLNEDFRKLMGTNGDDDATGAAVDVEINFCIAQVDPTGAPTDGVDRIFAIPPTNVATPGVFDDWELMTDVNAMKANTQWDPTQYLNIWTVKFGGAIVDNGGLAGLLGVAQFPEGSGLNGLSAPGPANEDGVVVSYNAFGSVEANDGSFVLQASYDLGRTSTHEVGHWLGLRHIWGDGDCAADDFCADTPITATFNNNCVVGIDTCPASPGIDQIQNYMDYTNDVCSNIFTQDQKDRMQTVMSISPRRMELNVSNACLVPAPYISFENANQTINEDTDCAFTDIVMTMKILEAPSQNADVTVSGMGTATDGIDYQVIGNLLTFPANLTDDQTFTLRIFNDGFVEVNETLTLSMVVNANNGDALPTTAPTLTNTITIVSDNTTPNLSKQAVLLANDGIPVAGWTIINDDGGATWTVTGGTNTPGVLEPDFYISQHADATADDYIVTAPFTVPANATGLSLSHALFDTINDQDYELWFATNTTSAANVLATGTLLDSGAAIDYIAGTSVLEVLNLDPFLPGLVGLTGSLVLRHVTSDPNNGGVLLWDTITLTVTVPTDVQTAENTATPTQVPLLISGSIYTEDEATNNLMADITNTNGVDYGCVATSVSRATGPAVMYQTVGVANFVMGKTFTITPVTVQAGGNATVKFYFTEAEIVQWETETGNVRGDLVVIKESGSNITETATIGAFGTNVTLEATFTDGINGTYYFGKAQTLAVTGNQFDTFSAYPNPSNGKVTLILSANEDVQISLFDIRGRNIYSKLHTNNSNVFSTSLDYSALASGIYMLNVESGTRRAIKKIVIQ